MSILSRVSKKEKVYPSIKEGQHSLRILGMEEREYTKNDTKGEFVSLRVEVSQDGVNIPSTINVFEGVNLDLALRGFQEQMGKQNEVVDISEIETFILNNPVQGWLSIDHNPVKGETYRNWTFYDPNPTAQPTPAPTIPAPSTTKPATTSTTSDLMAPPF